MLGGKLMEMEMYESPYQKEETECLIRQVNELRKALAMCWSLLPDGDYGAGAVAVKRCMMNFDCWPEGGKE